MAEYIEKADILGLSYCSYNGDCMGTTDTCKECKDNVIRVNAIDDIPTADVVEIPNGMTRVEVEHRLSAKVCNDYVERSKIDKAIDDTYKIRQEVLHNDNGCYEPNDVLDIIDEISKLFEEI